MEENEQVAEEKKVEPETTQARQDIISKQRFNQVYFKAKQAEREKMALQQELAALKQQIPDRTVRQPTLEDFDYDEDKFTRARMAYEERLVQQKINEAIEQKFQGISQQEQARNAAMVEQKFLERSAKYASENPEYDEVIGMAQGVEINQTASDIILNSDIGPALHHHLLTHPDVLERINSYQNPGMVGVELGRLETKLSRKPHSKAPEPITPGEGGAAARASLMDPGLPMEEFYRLANQIE